MNLSIPDLNLLVCAVSALEDDWEGSCVWPENGPRVKEMYQRLMDEIDRLRAEEDFSLATKNFS